MNIKFVALLSLLLGTAPLLAQECDEECQLSLATTYFERLSLIYHEGSTEAELHTFFALMHEQVLYQHIEYKADFDRKTWEAAFLRNLKRGAYGKASNESIRILKTIPGKTHLAVAYAYGKTDDKGIWHAQGEELLALFGFKEARIVLVREYW